MMNITYKIIGRGLLAGLFLVPLSCTNLDEEIFSALPADQFLTSEEEFVSALGTAYSSFGNFIGEPWSLVEVSSDEVVVPTRGADWFDNGNWQRIHLHQVEPGDDRVSNSWPELFGGVSNANRLLFQFEQSESDIARSFLAELRALRALFYWYLLDIYGNVPIVTDFTDTSSPSNNADFQAGRTEVYNFVVNEVVDGLDALSDNVGSTYGRINRYAAQALLAKLYLNSGVYLGNGDPSPEALNNALAAVNDIIDNGPYRLEDNYFDNFSPDNEGSAENIMVIVYDQVFAGGMNIVQRTLHYGSQQTFNLAEQPWNGYASLQEFYNSFDDDDARKDMFIEGPQFESDGVTPVNDPSVEASDPDGPQVNFTPEINEFAPNALRQAGVRIGKYEFELGAQQNMNNDYPIFRYADILLMKAEILWRLNPADLEALAYVNMVRERAGVAPLLALTADNLLAERGREVAFEYYRRQDLIRFDKFNDPWQFKPASTPDKNVFPIPRAQLEANPNLNQNPGY